MTRRTDQFASVFRDALQEVIGRGLADPRVSGLITVTGVKVSPDMARAMVLVSVLPEDRQTLTMHGLKAATAHIRREAGKLVRSRKLPMVEFRLDDSFKQQARIIEALSKVASERAQKAKNAGDPPREEGA